MKKKLSKVLLIDDDRPTNFFHEMIIRKKEFSESVFAYRGVSEAMTYLNSIVENGEAFPDLIFLDLNMPGLDGWDFIEAFKRLDSPLKSFTKIIVLTTTVSPREKKRALGIPEILDFKNKPLSSELLDEILQRHF